MILTDAREKNAVEADNHQSLGGENARSEERSEIC